MAVVRLWPKADICLALQNVRFGGKADGLKANPSAGADDQNCCHARQTLFVGMSKASLLVVRTRRVRGNVG